MTKIIRVEPIPEHFAINWMIGSLCNYDCMYCDKEWHDTTSKPLDLDTLKNAWNSIYSQTKHLNLPYKITFTGGEITANKNFLPLVNWLREELGEQLFVIASSNGSASLNYYKKLANVVDAISFSTHSEFMNEQEFFDKIRELNLIMKRPKKSVHVCIMDEYWNQERIELYKKFLEKNQISYSINRVNYLRQTRDFHETKGVYNLVKV